MTELTKLTLAEARARLAAREITALVDELLRWTP